jgi:glutathione S-transferase
MSSRRVTLFHSPQSRSGGALVLLEELGADYELQVLDLRAGEQREPAYRAINPLGKVPAIRHQCAHQDVVVTEQVAIYLYLADLYPEAGLAPRLDDPLRGPYLRWMSFYGCCFEPAIIDRSLKREPAAYSTSPSGDFDAVIGAIRAQLMQGPYFLGERFTAVDVLWGQALNWMLQFGLVPRSEPFVSYVERVQARPAFARATAQDAALLAAREQSGKTAAASGADSAELTTKQATTTVTTTATAAAATGTGAAAAGQCSGRVPFLGLRTAKYRATDLARARDWYAEVLDQPPYFDQPFYVGFDVGGFELGLDPDPAASGEGAGGVTVYWGVDAEAAYGRLIALGAQEHAPPQDVGEGIRIGAVRDPFGNIFGFVQNPHFKLRSPDAPPP